MERWNGCFWLSEADSQASKHLGTEGQAGGFGFPRSQVCPAVCAAHLTNSRQSRRALAAAAASRSRSRSSLRSPRPLE